MTVHYKNQVAVTNRHHERCHSAKRFDSTRKPGHSFTRRFKQTFYGGETHTELRNYGGLLGQSIGIGEERKPTLDLCQGGRFKT